jgi:transcriptional regulator with XRE-family HTH domain
LRPASKMKRRRSDLGITLKELAPLVKMSIGKLSAIERGAVPTEAEATIIAEMLTVAPDRLFKVTA